MASNPLVPIEITKEENLEADAKVVDVPSKTVSSTEINGSTSEASSPIPNVRRIVSDRLKNQVRNSRTASLIIPVVNTDSTENEEDEKDVEDIVDLDTTINDGTSLSDNDESFLGHHQSRLPPLPSRPPKTPPRKPLNIETHEYDPIDQYGMERVNAAQFSPVTLKSQTHENNDDNGNKVLSQHSTFEERRVQFLTHSRKYQVDYIQDLLTSAHLTVEDSVFFEKVHSSDVFIATLSQIRTGDYVSANQPVLFTLILKSLKVIENTFNNNTNDDENELIGEMIEGLSFLITSPEDEKLKFRNDISKVYSLFNIINEVKFQDGGNDERIIPNPLIAAFLYRCSSKFVMPQTLILALMLNEYVTSVNDESREFRFLLLRSIETIEPQLLLKKIDTFTNPLVYVNSLIDSNDFWLKFVQILYENEKNSKKHQYGLNKVLSNLVVYGVYYLIDVIVNLRHELGIFSIEQKPANIEQITPDLVRFHREFTILNESGESQFTNLTLDKLYSKNEELQRILQEKTDAYNILLNNYKQLNEEKMSVEDTISKHTDENLKLQATFTKLSTQVDQLLGQFDVIQQTVEKNERVKKLNESMRFEIERLKQENIKLLAK